MDAWLTQMYERHGSRYLIAGVAAVSVFALFVGVPFTVLCAAVYIEMSAREWVGAALAVDAAFMLGLIVGGLLLPGRTLLSWADGERSAEMAADADRWAYADVRRAFIAAAAVTLALGLPAAVAIELASLDRAAAVDLIELAIGGVAAWLSVTMVGYFLLELSLRPLRDSFRSYETPRVRSPGLATTFVVAVVSLVYVSTIAVGYLVVERGEAGGDMLIVNVIALFPTAFLAAGILLLISVNVLAPVSDLARGQKAVASGDLGARVPVTTGDELGELAAGFNHMVADLERSSAELRSSRSRIVAAGDAARGRVERDLHDGAQQSLVLLNMKLGLAERELAEDPQAAGQILAESRAELEAALAELRDLAHGIYPQVLTSDGLEAALMEAAQEASIEARVSADGTARYPPELEAAVYFCCLEALQNAAKHAGEGASVTVSLSQRDGSLSFEVADDGPGFDSSRTGGASGLQNMADRIGALGGELDVDSAPGEGTTVAGSVPLEG